MNREEQHIAFVRGWLEESRKRAHQAIDRAVSAAEAVLAGHADAQSDCVRASRELEMLSKAISASVTTGMHR